MEYDKIKTGRFIDRPNRFIAHVEIDGTTEVCHVKNTGRCKELLISNATVHVQEFDVSHRKTKYGLISVYKGNKLINIDSRMPNKLFHEWVKQGNLFSNMAVIKPEAKYGSSRFDFYVEDGGIKSFIEVKGVTLEENGIAMFPDAPTARGVKHINELCDCLKDGYAAYVIFIIKMKGVTGFTPNIKTHQAFGDALSMAEESGVKIIALDCDVSECSIKVNDYVRVNLSK
jgi:sugar fermentation stimulation protein A